MRPFRRCGLIEAFEAPAGPVYLIGGGGKTTLMFGLARDRAARGEKVITTTSTRILEAEAREGGEIEICSSVSPLLQRLARPDWSHLTLAKERDGGDGTSPPKLLGFSTGELEGIWGSGSADAMIVEADGSAGRSLKAHAGHEPVVSGAAALVIVVIGIDCLGMPLDDRWVHRSSLLSRRLSLRPGARIEPAHVARIVLHPEGYLREVSSSTRVAVALHKVDGDGEREAALSLAAALEEADGEGRIHRIVLTARGRQALRLERPGSLGNAAG